MSQEDVEIVRAVIRDVLNRDPGLDESWRDASEVYHEDFEYREDARDGKLASWQVVFDRDQALEAAGLR